jgi:integrase
VSTANKELGRMKHLFSRAVAWGYMKSNPARSVRKMKEDPGRIRYLTSEERESLLRAANPTLRLYILAALQTGARRGELARLRWADADMKRRTITFSQTKNGDRRVVPMTETLAEAIESLPRNIDLQALVFPRRDPHVITRSFGRLVKRLGWSDLTFHDLRHDAASTLTMAGVPQRTIMEILGHRDPRMTLRYQHLSPDYLKQAMRNLDQPSADRSTGKSSLGTI